MVNEKTTEKDLVACFKSAKEQRDRLKEELKSAQAEYDRAEADLIEFLEANSAVSTAKYEGLGYASLQKPRLFANCREEDLENLFEYLRKIKRIKNNQPVTEKFFPLDKSDDAIRK